MTALRVLSFSQESMSEMHAKDKKNEAKKKKKKKENWNLLITIAFFENLIINWCSRVRDRALAHKRLQQHSVAQPPPLQTQWRR